MYIFGACFARAFHACNRPFPTVNVLEMVPVVRFTESFVLNFAPSDQIGTFMLLVVIIMESLNIHFLTSFD
jgi:hypothetical protein